MTMEEAADKMGLSRKGYEKIERGERRLTAKHIALAAKAFGVGEIEIMGGASTIPVVGRVGAAGQVSPTLEHVPEAGFHRVELEFPLPKEMIAFEVFGDSMYPRYGAGDILICPKDPPSIGAIQDGDEAAIVTADGARLVKHVWREPGGTFRLESHNTPPISGARIVWASRIMCISRAGHYHVIQNHRDQK